MMDEGHGAGTADMILNNNIAPIEAQGEALSRSSLTISATTKTIKYTTNARSRPHSKKREAQMSGIHPLRTSKSPIDAS